ncbi:MAG: UDP-N-acetylmuramate dehydrogenase [Treponema sp.]|nr:UDP-N-acetylmuramate dehydrogenase [Treponema sp.]
MYNIAQIAQRFKQNAKIGLFFDESLAARSSFKIGGKASLLVEPQDEEALAEVLTTAKKESAPTFILGGGTNVLFADSGFDGIVVSTKKLSDISIIERGAQAQEAAPQNSATFQAQNGAAATIRAKAGASMAALVSFAQEKALTGLEEFAGLPGTVGGAAYMNARCFDKEISQVAAKISWLEWEVAASAYVQKSQAFSPSDWQYKKSPFTGTGRIVTSAEFVLSKGSADESAKKGAAYIQARKDKGHYKAPCAGSVFKNNRAFGRPTGKIIDELGLKGTSSGGAQIAPFHGNIIINNGGATAADVLALINLCKSRAKERFGFDLEEEIVVCG